MLGPQALRPRVPRRPLRRQLAARGRHQPRRSTRRSSRPPTINLAEHARMEHRLPRRVQRRRRRRHHRRHPDRSTGRRPSPARAPRSSPARASSTATTSSSSTASASTPSSRTSCVSAPARSRSARPSSSRSSPTSPQRRTSRACTEKALLTAALFGLPMFSVDMPGTRDTYRRRRVHRPVHDARVAPGSTTPTSTSTRRHVGAHGDWRDAERARTSPGPDGVASNPGEPALPRFVKDVGVGQLLRGIGFLGGEFTETSSVTPLVGAPGTEFGGAQTPFTSTTFFPSNCGQTSYFADLGGWPDEPCHHAGAAPRCQPGRHHGNSAPLRKPRSPTLPCQQFGHDGGPGHGTDDFERDGDRCRHGC